MITVLGIIFKISYKINKSLTYYIFFSPLRDPNLQLSSKNLASLKDLFESLQSQKIKIKDDIDDKKKILKTLCECLEISPNSKKQYLDYARYTKVINFTLNRIYVYI